MTEQFLFGLLLVFPYHSFDLTGFISRCGQEAKEVSVSDSLILKDKGFLPARLRDVIRFPRR
jgi:hypothetical protein